MYSAGFRFIVLFNTSTFPVKILVLTQNMVAVRDFQSDFFPPTKSSFSVVKKSLLTSSLNRRAALPVSRLKRAVENVNSSQGESGLNDLLGFIGIIGGKNVEN